MECEWWDLGCLVSEATNGEISAEVGWPLAVGGILVFVSLFFSSISDRPGHVIVVPGGVG